MKTSAAIQPQKKHSQFSEHEMSRWHVMVVIQYLLDSGYEFDDILFVPNISHRHESNLIHKVKFNANKVSIFLNRFIFPYAVYSAILDNEFTTEYPLLESMLIIESLLLKKHYQLLFIEFVGNQINNSTDMLLARKTDFFPNSPLIISDKITEILRTYGYIYGGVHSELKKLQAQGNFLSASSQLGTLEIGDFSQKNVKIIKLKLFLREEYAEQKLDWVKQQVLKNFEQLYAENQNNIPVKVEIFRHPVQPFSLGVNTLCGSKIYSPNVTVNF